MKIQEAIKVNEVLKKAPVLKNDPRIVATLNLNIEALKRLEWIRAQGYRRLASPLPGETED